MSAHLVSWSWLQAIPTADKLILLRLAHESEADGSFKIDQARAAAQCRLSEPEFVAVLSNLQAMGMLSGTARTRGLDGAMIFHGVLRPNSAELSEQNDGAIHYSAGGE